MHCIQVAGIGRLYASLRRFLRWRTLNWTFRAVRPVRVLSALPRSPAYDVTSDGHISHTVSDAIPTCSDARKAANCDRASEGDIQLTAIRWATRIFSAHHLQQPRSVVSGHLRRRHLMAAPSRAVRCCRPHSALMLQRSINLCTRKNPIVAHRIAVSCDC